MASALAFSAGAQTIALIGENDSLIIKKNLKTLVVSEDEMDGISSFVEERYSENIDEILDNQSEISLIKRGNYASEVVQRGFSSDRMSTTINGMKIFSACTDKMDPVTSYVSTNNLMSLDLEVDGHSKCYGSNTGGLLNLNTKEAALNDKQKVRGNLSLGGNSASKGWLTSFNTNYSEKNWALRLNGMYTDNQNYRAGGREMIQHSQYRKGNMGISLKTKISGKDFILLDFIRDDARHVGYPALPMDVSRATADIYSLTYRRYLSGKWSGKLQAKIYSNNIQHVMDDSERDVVMRMDMPGLSETRGGILQFDFKEKGRHSLSFLSEAYVNRSFAEMTMYPEGEREMYMLTWPDVYRKILGLYVGDKFKLNDKSNIFLTARLDAGNTEVRSDFGKKQLEVFGYDAIEPIAQSAVSTSIQYERSFGLFRSFLELSYSERLPTVSEQFAFYIFNAQDGYDYIGDPYMKNEVAYKTEIGLERNAKSLTWTISGYAYHMPNYIFGKTDEDLSAMTIGSKGVKRYINLDYARILGSVAELIWKANTWLSVQSSLTYNYGFDDQNRPLQLMAPLKSSTTLNFHFKQNRVGLKFFGAAEQNRFNKDAGENYTPGYLISDLTYQREMKIGQQVLTTIVGINNIFDVKYHDHVDWLDIPRLGRDFFLKFRYQF